jgi:hypothetical protein
MFLIFSCSNLNWRLLNFKISLKKSKLKMVKITETLLKKQSKGKEI